MIKLPKEIVHMIKSIEAAGFEAYAVGGCVRDSILGRRPEDWDLTSNASREVLGGVFPGAVIINKKLGVMRITEGDVTADIAAFRIDGEYKDYRRPETVVFTEDISEDLRRRDFTMNAIAVNPDRGVVDPYQGAADIEGQLIRGIGDPLLRFEEDALRILRGIRFSAQLGFQIEENTLLAMKQKANLLTHISMERIREEFTKTISAPNSGRGLDLLIKTGALQYVLGEECIKNAAAQELADLSLLAENLDAVQSDLSIRLALIYLCFEKNRALKSIERTGYSNEIKKLLLLAAGGELEAFRRIQSVPEMKKLACRIGRKSYSYLENLSAEQCRVFRLDDTELRNKVALFETARKNREPVFLEDLTVKGNDLMEIGIRQGIDLGDTLKHLLDVVHENPEKNEKKVLLQIARERNII